MRGAMAARFSWSKWGTTLGCLCLALLVSCADSPRENIVDPVNAPTIEMSAPVLDGGSILVEWRYLAEGSSLREFRVTRTVEEVTEEIGSVAGSATVGSEWQTVSLRDSSLVAGVRVTYQVTAVLSSGASSSMVSNSIQIEGATLRLLPFDQTNLAIRLEWSGVPGGATGFQIRRTGVDGSPETVFETDDASVNAFDDRDFAGDTPYSYQLITKLEGGGELGSPAVAAARFLHSRTNTVGGGLDGRKLLLFGAPFNLLAAVGNTDARIVDDAANRMWVTTVLAHDYRPQTVAIHGALARHSDLQIPWYIAGVTAQNEMTFAAQSGSSYWDGTMTIDTTLVWPSVGGSVGLCHFADQILVYEGTDVRVVDKRLNTGFEVIETGTFNTGEPVDVVYAVESLWLAYPDRLLRSRPSGVSRLSDISSWEDLPIPSGATITAITPTHLLEGSLIILDGVNGRIHLIDGNGVILVSWDALGSNLTSGDIQTYVAQGTIGWVAQADGDGNMYSFRPEGF